MSPTRKRKLTPDLESMFESISSLLSTIKPKLNDSSRSWTPALADLKQIAVLAESFSKQRPKSDENCLHLLNAVDREGVDLWNMSASLRESSDDNSRSIFAALKFAGFRLIEAGLEQQPGIETFLHVLQLACKAGVSLSEAGQNDSAAAVLASAAKYEEAARAIDDPHDSHAEAKARATVLYYASRMEVAWREGNDGVADYMLRKVSEDNIALLSSREREILASKLLEIGKSLLKFIRTNDEHATPAVPRNPIKWMQKAFGIAELLDDTASSGVKELKRSILRSLARAYFLLSSDAPDYLNKAEATLHELIISIDTSVDTTSAEYQQLRWMRIAVLKKRKAAVPVLLDAFRSLINHMTFTETSITDILQELRTFGHLHALVTAVLQHCVQRALDMEDRSGLAHIDRLLLSLIFHCSKGHDHSTSIQEIGNVLTSVRTAGYECSKTSATACLTLLWQFGDRLYLNKRWAQAADWFLLGTNEVFNSMAHISNSKCVRKAALCHVLQKEYAQASAVIRRSSNQDAATYYVQLLIAIHQGLEPDAMKAVTNMVAAADFDKKMLLLATRLANESDMKGLLLLVLEELLKSMQLRKHSETQTELVGLIRCIVRLDLKIMVDQTGDDLSVSFLTLVGHLTTASDLVASFPRENLSLIVKDISWLWRTAYNCAIRGSSEWGAVAEQVSNLFDIARKLIGFYHQALPTRGDAEACIYSVNASFASTAGKVFAWRMQRMKEADENSDLRALLEEVSLCKTRIRDALRECQPSEDGIVDRANSFLNVLSVFEIEILSHLKSWEQTIRAIEAAVSLNGLLLNTLEAIADILWVDKDCPAEVLLIALEAIIHASLDRSLLSVEKFSRWLRAVLTVLLSRNTSADRKTAMNYVEQAISVLEDHSLDAEPEVYPMDERQWLLGTTYNTGIECLHASLLDEARRWFETSTRLCRFVPDGDDRAAKVSTTYSQLLARYNTERGRLEDHVDCAPL